MQWALNWQAELAFPDSICEVPPLVEKGMQFSEHATSKVTLRDTGELLDTLDLHYRLHWLAREYRIKQQQPSTILLESIIQERHHALNWLTCYENVAWDNVDTPT